MCPCTKVTTPKLLIKGVNPNIVIEKDQDDKSEVSHTTLQFKKNISPYSTSSPLYPNSSHGLVRENATNTAIVNNVLVLGRSHSDLEGSNFSNKLENANSKLTVRSAQPGRKPIFEKLSQRSTRSQVK